MNNEESRGRTTTQFSFPNHCLSNIHPHCQDWQLATAANILCKKDRDLVILHSPYKPQFGNLFKFTLEALTWLWTLLNEGLSTQQYMKPGQHRRQQSPGIMVRGAIILKTLTESLTQYSLKSLTAEQHPGDGQPFDVLKNTFKCALCC